MSSHLVHIAAWMYRQVLRHLRRLRPSLLLCVVGANASAAPIDCSQALQLESDHLGVLLFDLGDAKLRLDSKRRAIAIFKQLEAANLGGYRQVLLVGHADQLGDDKTNLELSRRRVVEVKKHLPQGVLTSVDVQEVYCGQSNPLVPRKGEREHPHNRRVEIRLRSNPF